MMYARLLQAIGIGRVPGAMPDRVLQHAGDTNVCGTFTPEDDGPTSIVIGARAPMASLRRLAVKHGLEPESLVVFARKH